MKTQIFVELTTRTVLSDDVRTTYRKKIKTTLAFLPSEMELSICGVYSFFDVNSVNYLYSEKDPNQPIIIKLRRKDYPSAFIKMFEADPDWIKIYMEP